MNDMHNALSSAKAAAMKATRKAKRLETFEGVTLPDRMVDTIETIRVATVPGQVGYRLPDVSNVSTGDLDKAIHDYSQTLVTTEYADKARVGVLVALANRLNDEYMRFVPEAVKQATPGFEAAALEYKQAVSHLPPAPFSPKVLAQLGWQAVKAWDDCIAVQKTLESYATWINRDIQGEKPGKFEQWQVLVDVEGDQEAYSSLARWEQHMVGDDKLNIPLYTAAKNDYTFRLLV
ncbi:hypothetical protein [Actinophytocola sp. NPDC049390]|uniref:hypothetical protein n=1 Tax=Actinophytocola sp. NPDC049390 TaxID=3363894 RepID=UPI0037B20264